MSDTEDVEAEAAGTAAYAEAVDVLGPFRGPVFLAPLTHNPNNGVTGGVWSVTAGERTAVLKVLTRSKGTTGHWAASDEPRHWNYWRREADVHVSGLAQLWRPYGIRAPRLLACVERQDGDVALWLELPGAAPAPGGRWNSTSSTSVASASRRAPSVRQRTGRGCPGGSCASTSPV
ncbi:hypothetical protein ABZ027_02145 [Streptomyces sp. NPDC006332]|uniref:hypothetical protein n=1 Tax=Streptomyces sp. NPDC006332 TaxID=3155456 RepID=UPI00339E66B1